MNKLRSKASTSQTVIKQSNSDDNLYTEDPPRVYKLAREKQSLSPLRKNSDGDHSKDFHYKGNFQDLQPFYKKEGKYRIASNLS